MLAAASAWDTLAAELQSGASSYGSVVSALADEWQGPSSGMMEDAAAPYVTWLTAAGAPVEDPAPIAKVAVKEEPAPRGWLAAILLIGLAFTLLFAVGVGIWLLSFIFLPILAFGPATYVGPRPTRLT